MAGIFVKAAKNDFSFFLLAFLYTRRYLQKPLRDRMLSLGCKWKTMSDNEKQEWVDIADLDLQRFRLEYRQMYGIDAATSMRCDPWRRMREKLLTVCSGLAPLLHSLPYVLIEIFDWIPAKHDVPRFKKMQLIESVMKYFHQRDVRKIKKPRNR